MEQAIDTPAEGDEATEAAPKGGRKWLWITLVIALLGAGGGAWWWFQVRPNAEPAVVELAPPVYLALEPPFVVNFEAQEAVRFLQVSVQLMTRDPATAEAIKTHDPVIRNDLLMLLSNHTYEQVSTREGKEALRAACLEAVRAVVKRERGDPASVESLYFTSFVMQ